MTDDDHARKLEELERILNDPDVSLDPARVWSLLAEVSQRDYNHTSTAEPVKGLGRDCYAMRTEVGHSDRCGSGHEWRRQVQ
jgi:hypothetical protein